MSQPTPSRSVIVGGARTPMGRLLGSLKDFSAADLGGVAIKAALERAGLTGDQVDYVIMGQVLQAGAGAADELRDRRLRGQRGQQLDAGLAVPDGEHRLVDALLLVDLLVHRGDAEGQLVEGDRLPEVGHRDAHVVDGGEQVRGQAGVRVVGHPPHPAAAPGSAQPPISVGSPTVPASLVTGGLREFLPGT